MSVLFYLIILGIICDPVDEYPCIGSWVRTECINASLVCDGVDDCELGVDEHGCDGRGKPWGYCHIKLTRMCGLSFQSRDTW